MRTSTVAAVEGYDETTYGRAFADVYDEWYDDVSDVDATVTTLGALAAEVAGNAVAEVLELGVGTGRLAVPLATDDRRHRRVTGVDASPEMLTLLAEHDPDGLVRRIEGDMVAAMPDGPFHLAFVAYNTLFNLTGDGEQARCFRSVADRLVPGGRFVVEAFVPDEPPREGDVVSVRTLTADKVVLSISRHDAEQRTAQGQFVELTEAAGVRLRPWSIRYSSPGELDAMAADAGLRLESRWLDVRRRPFDADADRHVSVYRRD